MGGQSGDRGGEEGGVLALLGDILFGEVKVNSRHKDKIQPFGQTAVSHLMRRTQCLMKLRKP